MSGVRRILVNLWDWPGLRWVWLKFVPDRDVNLDREPSTGLLWTAGICVALFGLASQLYQNDLDLIENRVASIHSLAADSPAIAVPRMHRMFASPEHDLLSTPGKRDLWRPVADDSVIRHQS